MTDEEKHELIQLRQKNLILEQRAQMAELRRRCDKLQKMNDDAQKYIQTLQRKLKRDLAENVFGGNDG